MAIGIDSNRMQHMLGVARKMEAAAHSLGWSEISCREMFILGLLHDIGYQWADNAIEHNEIGGATLAELEYPYYEEVMQHGNPDKECSTYEMALLDWADMTTSSTGSDVTMKQRLDDIADRYGENSQQYNDAKRVCEQVSKKLASKKEIFAGLLEE